jgi:hypothetical protein
METIHEQIALWMAAALDGVKDPDETMTLQAVRPKVLDWNVENFRHGDVIIAAEDIATNTIAGSVRAEDATWKLYGIIRELPANTAADTVVSRMIETIRRTLLAGNTSAQACGGLAVNINCPEAAFSLFEGGLIAEVTVTVLYRTGYKDGYAEA